MDTDPLASGRVDDRGPPPSEAAAEAEALAEEEIARRAYEISQADRGGTAEENRLRNEAELGRG